NFEKYSFYGASRASAPDACALRRLAPRTQCKRPALPHRMNLQKLQFHSMGQKCTVYIYYWFLPHRMNLQFLHFHSMGQAVRILNERVCVCTSQYVARPALLPEI